MKIKSYLAFPFLALSMIACGGGSDDGASTTSTVNNAPTARMSLDNASVSIGDLVSIQGGQSSDPDSDSLSYLWQVSDPQGMALALSDAKNKQLSFNVTMVGEYQVSLTVSDGKGANDKAKLALQVAGATNASTIVAVISSAETVKQGNIVTLSGESSRLTADTRFSWSLLEKPATSEAALTSTNTVETYFTADKLGEYKVQLSLKDQNENTDVVQRVITATSVTSNTAPVASITAASTELKINEELTLSAAQSTDADGDTLSFSWQVIQQPDSAEIKLEQAATQQAKFSANSLGEYQVELTVSDGKLQDKKQLKLQVTAANRSPVVSINLNSNSPKQGETINLQGVGVDPDNDSLSYSWSLVSKPSDSSAQFSNSNQQNTQLYLDAKGDYLVSLTASDNQLTSAPATKRIRVAVNHPPVITKVIYDTYVIAGSPTKLEAQATDPEGQSMIFEWRLTDKDPGTEGTFSAPTQSVTEFTPDLPGWYTLEVSVSDGIQKSLLPNTLLIIAK
ncbi:PKD domain-containing protein [Shewanella sp. SR44-3]|uniref:PKD domain-containing protein n=1 Tax=Shewanella sp. SR44-3 TaxID=2760936 RepID=UPI0015FCA7AB|nr:PKD domain-containing protein [Shewanella sp. SR44-3]MBB1268760.1 hypothetical protein [Shewanella sp. SR44-3]